MGESACNDFQHKLQRRKETILKKGLSLEDVPHFYPCHKNDLRVAQDVHVEPPEPVSAVAKCGEISTSVIPHIQSLCCAEVPMPPPAEPYCRACGCVISPPYPPR